MMKLDLEEYSSNMPIKARGFTSVEAYAFLRKEFPEIKMWTCWQTAFYGSRVDLAKIVGRDEEGGFGQWTWKRVETNYPPLFSWSPRKETHEHISRWLGAVEFRHCDGREFILFSCLNSRGRVGDFYLVSTRDENLLQLFADDIREFLSDHENIIVKRCLMNDLKLPVTRETMILETSLQEDIERQVDSFFKAPEVYAAAGIPYRRGFLFVGPPGTGKTMMVRRILRKVHSIGGVSFLSLPLGSGTDDSDIEMLFNLAREEAPSIVILEDVDSLTSETKVTRAVFLSQLDGLAANDGILVIGTTNHPEKVDPALSHRPCRFDRVWKFGYPALNTRIRYIKQVIGLKSPLADEIAKQAEGWSFAYLKELQVTAMLMAINEGKTKYDSADIQEAARLLREQHHSGERGHEQADSKHALGFVTA